MGKLLTLDAFSFSPASAARPTQTNKVLDVWRSNMSALLNLSQETPSIWTKTGVHFPLTLYSFGRLKIEYSDVKILQLTAEMIVVNVGTSTSTRSWSSSWTLHSHFLAFLGVASSFRSGSCQVRRFCKPRLLTCRGRWRRPARSGRGTREEFLVFHGTKRVYQEGGWELNVLTYHCINTDRLSVRRRREDHVGVGVVEYAVLVSWDGDDAHVLQIGALETCEKLEEVLTSMRHIRKAVEDLFIFRKAVSTELLLIPLE